MFQHFYRFFKRHMFSKKFVQNLDFHENKFTNHYINIKTYENLNDKLR